MTVLIAILNGSYRFGFNGKENDSEVEGQQDYGFRIYDNRLGRFKSVGPLMNKYPYLTPYQFASNSPISGVDLDGLEYYSNFNYTKDLRTGKTTLQVERGVLPMYKEVIDKYGPPPISNTVHRYYLTVINEKGESEKFVLHSQESSGGRESLKHRRMRDRTFNGDFTGVSKIGDDGLAELMAHGLDAISKYKRTGKWGAIIFESSKGTLDYKYLFEGILDIPWNNLIEIEGITYNPNEAGNVVWSMLFSLIDMADLNPGSGDTPELGAAIFERLKNKPLTGEESKDRDALRIGSRIGKEKRKDANFMQKVKSKRESKD